MISQKTMKIYNILDSADTNKTLSAAINLGIEKSTGEVIGFDKHLGSAYAKAESGSGQGLPINGRVFKCF